jgi:hypothetical protein
MIKKIGETPLEDLGKTRDNINELFSKVIETFHKEREKWLIKELLKGLHKIGVNVWLEISIEDKDFVYLLHIKKGIEEHVSRHISHIEIKSDEDGSAKTIEE